MRKLIVIVLAVIGAMAVIGVAAILMLMPASTTTNATPATPTETVQTTPPSTSGNACDFLPPEIHEMNFVSVLSPGSGHALRSGDEVTGCSRTFESNVNWFLVDRQGNEIAAGFTMGGGVDGAGPYSFTVEYTVDQAQTGHLWVVASDPSGGEGFPPPENKIVVVLYP
jgi:hypothetical protein